MSTAKKHLVKKEIPPPPEDEESIEESLEDEESLENEEPSEESLEDEEYSKAVNGWNAHQQTVKGTLILEEEETDLIPDFSDLSNIFVIGDVHFQKDAFLQGEELIEKCVDAAKNASPTIIVLLGDILDTHETAKNTPYKQTEKLIEELSAIAPLYVIMGNHDLINQSQFLTNNHFFNPFKKWPGVTIVDVPISVKIGDNTIVMCPYVAPGRFIEALNTMFEYEDPVDWQLADCIFAHQEVRVRNEDGLIGVVYNGKESSKADIWDEVYPPLICGHIHDECRLGTNVYYMGSARQVNFDESPDKRVWNITFDEEGFQHDKIDLGLKARKEIEMEYENIKSFDFDLLEKYYIKIKLKGTREQFKLFRKSQLHAKLSRLGVKIAFDPEVEDNPFIINLGSALKDDVSFEGILRELIKTKPAVIQEAYEEMYGPIDGQDKVEENTIYELVFID